MNTEDLDQQCLDLVEHLSQHEAIAKAIPARLYYRLRAWYKKMRPKMPVAAAAKMLAQKVETELAAQSLSKREVAASIYQGGEVRFDFGSEVPDQVRKAAFSWAKRRGLVALEASLAKSDGSSSSVTFCRSNSERSYVVAHRMRFGS